MPVRIVICKARRAGLSTGVSSLIYDDTTTNEYSKSLIVANEKNPSENVLGMYTRFWKESPEYFELAGQRIMVRPPLPPEYNNNPPKDRLLFAPPLDSGIYVATARSIDAFLGYGFQNIHATEASRYVDGHELFRSLYPTLSSEAHSALYIESTPNGQEGRGRWFYEQCMDAQARKDTQYGEMRLVFIPWHEMTQSFAVPFESDEKRIAFGKQLNGTERDLLRRFPHISLEQLNWRRMMLAGPTFNRDEDMFDQEYPTDLATAFLLSGNSVFGRKSIKRLMSNVREPIWSGDVYWGVSDAKNESEPIHELVRRPHFYTKGQARALGFEPHVNENTYNNLKVYRWPTRGERIIVTCDVGGGNPESRDGDYSVIMVGVLNELERDELIMTWRGHINPIAFGEVAAALCWGLRYQVGESVTAPELVPEWTGPGSAMCVYCDDKNLYRVYRWQPFGKTKMKATSSLGWQSDSKTKPYMIGATLRMIDDDKIDVPDQDLVLEMSTYRQLDNFGDAGSYGGAAGRHDDMVSAFQILCAMMRLRSSIIPGETDVEEVEVDSYYDPDLPTFDPFVDPTRYIAPGVQARDIDDESLDEGLFWSSDDY
jgi:hypothetical protein